MTTHQRTNMSEVYGHIVTQTEQNVRDGDHSPESVPRIVNGVIEEVDQVFALGMIGEKRTPKTSELASQCYWLSSPRLFFPD